MLAAKHLILLAAAVVVVAGGTWRVVSSLNAGQTIGVQGGFVTKLPSLKGKSPKEIEAITQRLLNANTARYVRYAHLLSKKFVAEYGMHPTPQQAQLAYKAFHALREELNKANEALNQQMIAALPTPKPMTLQQEKEQYERRLKAEQKAIKEMEIPGPASPPGAPPGFVNMIVRGGAGKDSSEWNLGYNPATSNQFTGYSGHVRGHPQEGVIFIVVTSEVLTPHKSTRGGAWIAPRPIGGIAITAVHGNVIDFDSDSGVTGTFNMVTHQWTFNPAPG